MKQKIVRGYTESPKVKIFLLSFLILFLELSLIRHIPANVLLTAYFSILVLMGTFFGLGVGFPAYKNKSLNYTSYRFLEQKVLD